VLLRPRFLDHPHSDSSRTSIATRGSCVGFVHPGRALANALKFTRERGPTFPAPGGAQNSLQITEKRRFEKPPFTFHLGFRPHVCDGNVYGCLQPQRAFRTRGTRRLSFEPQGTKINSPQLHIQWLPATDKGGVSGYYRSKGGGDKVAVALSHSRVQ